MQECIRLFVVGYPLGFGVPLEPRFRPQGNIREVGEGRRTMARLEIAVALLTRLNAIQEVS